MIHVEFLPDARQELFEAISRYQVEDIDLALRFVIEVEHGLLQIKSMPNGWPLMTRNSRRYRLRRFPYGLVYQVRGNNALVIAVMHLHRRPNYWRGRELK